MRHRDITFVRCILLMFVFIISACNESSQASANYPSYAYDHLSKIELNVRSIDIDDNWVPRGAGRRVEHIAPISLREAQRRMAEDRLIAVGASGRAVFVIEDASIVRGSYDYHGTLAVRVDIVDDTGIRLGHTRAQVELVRSMTDETELAMRADLYDFVRDLMAEMNIVFEYNIRHTLQDVQRPAVMRVPELGKVDAQPIESVTLDPLSPRAAPNNSTTFPNFVLEERQELHLGRSPTSQAQPTKTDAGPATERPVLVTRSGLADRPIAFAQLGVVESEATAPEEWRRLRRRLGTLLQGRELLAVKAEVGGRVIWRLRMPFATRAEAVSFCETVRGVGAACWASATR